MNPQARIALILLNIVAGFGFWPTKWAVCAWVLAGVYAILTSPRRYL